MGAWEEFKERHKGSGTAESNPEPNPNDRTWTPELRDKFHLFGATGGYGTSADAIAHRMLKERERRQGANETGQRVILRDLPKNQ